jgi:hypothetical protein
LTFKGDRMDSKDNPGSPDELQGRPGDL